jgi:DNA end-binding protein Ku
VTATETGLTSVGSAVIRFNVLNRKTGNRVRSVYVDEETKDEVPADQQQKGWEVDKGDFLPIDAEEIKALDALAEDAQIG